MIVKELKYPIYIKKLEALLLRLPPTHIKRKEISEEIAKQLAGFKGEQSLDYYLSFLPENHLILHDLRLKFKQHHFQIDTLILTFSFFLILEVKNLSGRLIFDHHNQQLIRKLNDIEEVFPDPLLQAKRQKYQMVEWLRKNKFKNIPFEEVVVITNSSSHIEATPSDLMQTRIIRNTYIIEKVKELQATFKDEELYLKRDLLKLSQALINNHEAKDIDVLQKFNILESELIKGVQCVECNNIPMKHHLGKWNCSNCENISKDAHLKTIKDFQLLSDLPLTNRRLRDMLFLQSKSISKKYLVSLKLHHTGTTRDRVYHFHNNEA
ncbi:nuclease-related domain-containing protein [Litchfieldia alkalitelluris]|uniref:nuclease-related domain-containing protein n=1 Tax=Litchfieldia alkalitelluris TaxID=304268 RepID=UPI001475E254|nr:nuclease-related domain-containing protein [Litchfieldia alkalitelluris]